MNHWDNMANRLAELKDVQIKTALQKEIKIIEKGEAVQKRFENQISFQKKELTEKDKLKQQRREELSKKLRQREREDLKKGNHLAHEYGERLVKKQQEYQSDLTQIQLRAQMKTTLEKSNQRHRQKTLDSLFIKDSEQKFSSLNHKIQDAGDKRVKTLEKSAKKHSMHIDHVLSRKELVEKNDEERVNHELEKDHGRVVGYLDKLKKKSNIEKERVDYLKDQKQKHLDNFYVKDIEIKRDVVRKRQRLDRKDLEISKKLQNHQNQNEALLKQIAERKRLLHQDVAEFKDRDKKQI